jgi:hypothetical protein
MKPNMRLIIGFALLLVGVGGLTAMRCGSNSMGGMGMQGGSEMMGQGNMKEMMKRMMGDQLPPGIDAADIPDSQSQGALLLARYCTQCHDLPPPALHTSGEWPKVFARMNRRMKMMSQMGSIQNPTDQERTTILNYLQRHTVDASG